MANNTNTSWERIQQGVSDTERLIGQKEYNGLYGQSAPDSGIYGKTA